MKKLLVTLLAVGFVFVLSASAFAEDATWSWYGNARINTFYSSNNDDSALGDKGLVHDALASQVGAWVKKGAIAGRFEVNTQQDGNAVTTRRFYGTADLGGAKILIGQDSTPLNMYYSSQVAFGDANILNAGFVFNGRHPMIQFQIGGFTMALVKDHSAALVGAAGNDVDIKIPKIEAAYHFVAGDAFFADIMGGYQTFQIENTAIASKPTYDVTSYVGAIGFGVNLGPAFIRAGGFYAKNYKDYGLWCLSKTDGTAAYSAGAIYDAASDSIKDMKTIGAGAVVGFKFTPAVIFEAGVGYMSNKSDSPAATENDDNMVYYAQVNISPVPGFYVIPEIGYYDYKKNLTGVDQGNMWYAGVKTQVSF